MAALDDKQKQELAMFKAWGAFYTRGPLIFLERGQFAAEAFLVKAGVEIWSALSERPGVMEVNRASLEEVAGVELVNALFSARGSSPSQNLR